MSASFHRHYFHYTMTTLLPSHSSDREGSEREVSEEEDSEEVTPSSLSPGQLEKLKEAVDDRKKLIQSLRGKPWAMKKKLATLR